MKTWRTNITLSTPNTKITTDTISVKRGIFQGDSLSALWFCICLNPLSQTLNNTNYGFRIKNNKQVIHKINNLLYMDDINLYAATEKQLKNLLKIIEQITIDMQMEFGIEKCKTQHINRGVREHGKQLKHLITKY